MELNEYQAQAMTTALETAHTRAVFSCPKGPPNDHHQEHGPVGGQGRR